ncbi:MAG TPA: ABC transporter ATP-binding protein [Vicinamibacterales bacterium]|jgi:ABC-type multidrug transport system ATPase subunit|nr:ABC transporter ATP-binding protein [Vicinamibacterales bacterium]
MLTISGLTKSFGGRRVLDGLDLHVDPGESVALLGANGSGKTTTLRCIVGLARPDTGCIAIGGIDAVRRPIESRARVSYLPQKSVFPLTLTVRETLAVVARLRGLDGESIDRELDACGLTSLADRGVAQLSGGERQRLAIAVAFLPAVDLYLFDEPSANLDPVASRMLFRRARQLRREGRTLLFTTHVPGDVRHLASRAVCLRDGRIESEAAGEFELRRCERLLERELWGDDHEDPTRGAGLDDRHVVDDRLREGASIARAGSGRSR